jgi:hypothetical protein
MITFASQPVMLMHVRIRRRASIPFGRKTGFGNRCFGPAARSTFKPNNRKIANDELQEGYNFNFRFRYLLNLMVPLNREFIQPNTVFLAFNDEIHINAGKQITYNVFDQNRLFVGLGYQFTKGLNVQVGYMNQFQQLPSGNHFNSNNVLRLFVFHNLDLRKKTD